MGAGWELKDILLGDTESYIVRTLPVMAWICQQSRNYLRAKPSLLRNVSGIIKVQSVLWLFSAAVPLYQWDQMGEVIWGTHNASIHPTPSLSGGQFIQCWRVHECAILKLGACHIVLILFVYLFN